MVRFRVVSEDPFKPGRVRRAIDALLARYPYFDLVEVDWHQAEAPVPLRPYRFSERPLEFEPWVSVKLGEPSVTGVARWAVWQFEIWRATGDVYRVDHWGAVEDEPLIRGEERSA